MFIDDMAIVADPKQNLQHNLNILKTVLEKETKMFHGLRLRTKHS